MPDIEAIGDVATGALLGRSVEPRAGEIDGHTAERACLNCGCALVGDYCHCCGQQAHVHRTLTAFWHDFLHGVLHFEGKIWRTLPMLAWRPGELTRRYVAGERAKFVSPLALFLFSVFLMFAVASFTGNLVETDSTGVKKGLSEEIQAADRQIAKLEAERRASAAAGLPTAALDTRIKDAREGASLLRTISERGFVKGTTVRMSDDMPAWTRAPLQHAADNPALLLYKLKTNAYKFSWALIPLSVPFLWLLFPLSRRFRLYDHAVFVTYSLSFMSLLAIAAMAIAALGISAIVPLAMFVPPIHMYRQLKGAYGLTRTGALLRTVALVVFACCALMLFGLALLALGLL